MFNLFKSKIELKNTNTIMSSFYISKGLKIGSEFIVPSNFEGLIFHRGKHYITFQSGKYKVDKENFADLFERQQKSKSKLKHIKCVCHYINTSPQKLEIRYKKQKFIVEFVIENPITFADFMLLYAYKVTNIYTQETLNDMFIELLIYNKGDHRQIKNNSLANFGITINSFAPLNNKVSIFNKNSTKQENKVLVNDINTLDSISDSLQNDNNKQNDQNENIINKNTSAQEDDMKNVNNLSQINQQSTFPACPKCNNIAKFNTTYCLKCGYKLQ